MPIHGFPGGVISSTAVTPSSTSASGVWTLDEQLAAQGAGNWPAPPPPPLLVTKSLRFRPGSTTQLYKNISTTATDRKKFTFSTWVKRTSDSASVQVIANHTGDDWIYFYNNKLYFEFTGALLATNQLFRDQASWYHLMCVCDTTQATSTDRMKIYVNGSQVTSFATNTPPALNYQSTFMTTGDNYIGCYNAIYYLFNGYMAETHHIDGQALTPSYFGSYNADTGVWQPVSYSGTYGNNGFYLPFTNTTSTSTLGNDFSGNGNNWTVNNFSLTAGYTYDSMTDVPTLTSATASNFCTLNPLIPVTTTTAINGNLGMSGYNPSGSMFGTVGVSSGKWYFEYIAYADAMGGISGTPNGGAFPGAAANAYTWDSGNATKYSNGSGASYGSSTAEGDVVGVAVDLDTGSITFYKNNVSQGTAYTFTPSGSYFPAFRNGSSTNTSVNFGQRPFAYTPPTGFVALNTFNLPTPTIGATASSQANKYFDATLYTGNGATSPSSLAVVNAGGFQPDFVWIKSRSNAYPNFVWDAIRGVANDAYLVTNDTLAENSDATGNQLSSFNSNGFSVQNTTTGSVGTNNNGSTFVGWQWNAGGSTVTNTSGSISSQVRANTTSGFSVVTYTEPASGNYTIGHGLGVAPSMIIVKPRNTAGDNWVLWHQYWQSVDAVPTKKGQYLNSTLGSFTTGSDWLTSLTSTVFGITPGQVTPGSSTMVAYCFSEVAGYSKFGSYTGNGSADGTFVYTGFRPRWVMFKCSSQNGGYWVVLDAARNTSNLANLQLFPNAADADTTGGSTDQPIDILSNGFKLRGSGGAGNDSGQNYVYACFAENPFKYANAR